MSQHIDTVAKQSGLDILNSNMNGLIQRITLLVEFTTGSGTIASESINGTPFAAYDSSGYIYNISKNGSNWVFTGFYIDGTGKAVFVVDGQRNIVISYHKNS